MKRDTETGRFMDGKTSNETAFKGVRKENKLSPTSFKGEGNV